jgi:hypothetical protein
MLESSDATGCATLPLMKTMRVNWKFVVLAAVIGIVAFVSYLYVGIERMGRRLETMDFSAAARSKPVRGMQTELKVISWLARRGSLSRRESRTPVDPPRTCHIHGTIRNLAGAAVSNVDVVFRRDTFTKTVFTDEEGSYDVDLPAGLYTMTASPLERFLEGYRRPLFRVGSSTTLTLDVTFNPIGGSCDLVSPVGAPRPNADDARSFCGGWDSFPVPSEDGVPFEIFVRFQSGHTIDHKEVYSTRKPLTGVEIPPLGQPIPDDWPAHSRVISAGIEIPVFVAYNLFTLRADKVVYDVPGRTLEATGNVVADNANGATQLAHSMKFRIENGEAIPLP